VPEVPDLPTRLHAVLGVVYFIFNEGYGATAGAELMRTELCDEAVRLGRLLMELLPREPEVIGLLALMLLVDARRTARVDAAGGFVKLADQDRRAWDRQRIEEGQSLLRLCLARNEPGPYQLQAAINAVHSDAHRIEETDWSQILALYDRWMRIAPSQVVALNRAVVVAEIEGVEAGLRIVEGLAGLSNYQPYHAVKADLLKRCGKNADAAVEYRIAIEMCGNEREREFLEKQYRSIARN
jgi:RNA polymerase sigma-70 factor (ECF subfamily)